MILHFYIQNWMNMRLFNTYQIYNLTSILCEICWANGEIQFETKMQLLFIEEFVKYCGEVHVHFMKRCADNF